MAWMSMRAGAIRIAIAVVFAMFGAMAGFVVCYASLVKSAALPADEESALPQPFFCLSVALLVSLVFAYVGLLVGRRIAALDKEFQHAASLRENVSRVAFVEVLAVFLISSTIAAATFACFAMKQDYIRLGP